MLVRLARVIILAAAALLAVTGCRGPGGQVTYVAAIPRFSNLGYVDLIQWVPGHAGKVTGTLTSTSVIGEPHSVRLVTARYHFTGKIVRGQIQLTVRGWQLPDFMTFGPLKGDTLKLVGVPQTDGNIQPGTFHREDAAAYYAKVAAVRRQIRRADS